MRRVVLFGFVLVCVSVLCFHNVTPVEEENLTANETIASTEIAPPPRLVEVTNFPAVQAVSGTVNVENLPATQNVTGTVAVSNLPLGVDGSVKVISPPIHYVGITQVTFTYTSAPLPWSRECASAFPGTRVCDVNEVIRSIPPPPEWAAGGVLTTRNVIAITGAEVIDNACLNNLGIQDCNNLPPMIPVACCGF